MFLGSTEADVNSGGSFIFALNGMMKISNRTGDRMDHLIGVIVQTLRDPERNPVGPASYRHEGNDPSVDQFSLPVDAIEILNHRSGLGSNAYHLRNPQVACRDRPIGQMPFQLCTKPYHQMRDVTRPAPARSGKDKGRGGRSFPQIAQMIERICGPSVRRHRVAAVGWAGAAGVFNSPDRSLVRLL